MSDTLDQLLADLVPRVESFINSPNEASRGLEELRERLQALGGSIGAGAKNDALKALAGSERDIKRARQREAADAIAAAMRPLGVILVAQAPPQRQRRKAKLVAETAAPAAEQEKRKGIFGMGRTG